MRKTTLRAIIALTLYFTYTSSTLLFFAEAFANSQTDPQVDAPATPKEQWIESRVAAAHERMQKTKGGQIVMKSIEAHGGLKKWFANGPLIFRFVYAPVKGGSARDSIQTVDTWTSRARHQVPAIAGAEFGWDGSNGWHMGPDAKFNPRFWSLTPYYFIAMPFVLADPGINYKYEGTYTFEGKKFELVKITYGKNIGDSPNDYYIVLIEHSTHLLRGTRYIVSYEGFFKNGGHSPEKLMMFDGTNTVDGIIFPKTARSFPWAEGKPGELSVRSTISQVKFDRSIKDSYFKIPAGATIQKTM